MFEIDDARQHTPLDFVYTGGYFPSGSLVNEGSHGYYWSRTAYSGEGAYNLFSGSSFVYPQNGYGRGYGFALRCVGR